MADQTPIIPPDLASILATLAQFAPAQEQFTASAPTPPPPPFTTTDPRLQGRQLSQSVHAQSQLPFDHAHDNSYLHQHQNGSTILPGLRGRFDPNEHPEPASASNDSYDPAATSFAPPIPQQQRARPQQQSQPPDQNIIDPATITEWSAGLRCVTKIAAQSQPFAEKIRSMINDQRRNEMQWYSSRQALKQTQAKRAAGANEIQNILKAVGGGASASTAQTPPLQTPEEKEAELAEFDRKVYKAQVSMNESMSNMLKGLGVPFFGTHASLILPDSDDGDSDTPGQDVQGERPKWSPRITANDLLELKRRMVTYLEDMYKT